MTTEASPYPRHGSFWRCGYRIDRLPDDLWKFERVRVSKGEWRYMMDPWIFDAMSDADFAHVVGLTYRETAFGQLEEDLATLAVAVRCYIDREFGSMPPWSEVSAAVRRYEAAQERP